MPKPVSQDQFTNATNVPLIADFVGSLPLRNRDIFRKKWAQYVAGHPEIDFAFPERQDALKLLIMETFIQEDLQRTMAACRPSPNSNQKSDRARKILQLSTEYSRSIRRFEMILTRLLKVSKDQTPFGPGTSKEEVEAELDGNKGEPSREDAWDTEEKQFGEKLHESEGRGLPEGVREEGGGQKLVRDAGDGVLPEASEDGRV